MSHYQLNVSRDVITMPAGRISPKELPAFNLEDRRRYFSPI
jgi:hypothetical protein